MISTQLALLNAEDLAFCKKLVGKMDKDVTRELRWISKKDGWISFKCLKEGEFSHYEYIKFEAIDGPN